jgi:hypothetical protein
MRLTLDPFRLLLISLAGYLNQQQQEIFDYLQEKNGVLCAQLGSKRLRLNDDQRRRLPDTPSHSSAETTKKRCCDAYFNSSTDGRVDLVSGNRCSLCGTATAE